jgi:hypothetical protein
MPKDIISDRFLSCFENFILTASSGIRHSKKRGDDSYINQELPVYITDARAMGATFVAQVVGVRYLLVR